jgi:ribosome maturation protein SDO1
MSRLVANLLSLKAILEIPAAARPNVIDRLGAITKGTAFVEVVQ